jgi:uncharacterized SAM-binding protein YcdF (DUF218 family)
MSDRLKIMLIAVSFALILLTAVCYAPAFFAYADEPIISDAIILFTGPDFTAREKEAHRLLDEGYARFLIIPAFQNVFTSKNIPPQFPDVSDHKNYKGYNEYPRFYENTHIEVLNAHKMMNALEFKSAIMVSSPNHMKRIRLISQKVFGDQSLFVSYVPTRFLRCPAGVRDMAMADWMHVIEESVKICWFRIYSSLV